MLKININSSLNEKKLIKLNSIYEKSNFSYISLKKMCKVDIRKLIDKLILFINDYPLSEVILQIIIEEYPQSINKNDLIKIFIKGDEVTKTTVCLCDKKLPYILFIKCLYSNKMNVLAHFIFRPEVSIKQCKRVLKMPIGKTIQNEILRAIKVKGKIKYSDAKNKNKN